MKAPAQTVAIVWRFAPCFLVAAFSFALATWMRPVSYALAIRSFVPLDCDGLAELGLWQWTIRACASLGISDAWFWVPSVVPLVLTDFLLACASNRLPWGWSAFRWLPPLATALTLCWMSEHVWVMRDVSVPVEVALGFLLFSFLIWCVSRRCRPRPPQAMPSRRRLVLFAACAVVSALVLWFARPLAGLRGQFEAERAVLEGDWTTALSADMDICDPLPMRRAYFTLALYRTDGFAQAVSHYRLPQDFYSRDADELLMDGFILLQNYGLILPARRWLYERIAHYGWSALVLKLLGENAVVRGRIEEARRYYHQLARLPFFGAEARRRLDALDSETPAVGFADLVQVAGDSQVLDQNYGDFVHPFMNVQDVERFIYSVIASQDRVSKAQAELLKFLNGFQK